MNASYTIDFAVVIPTCNMSEFLPALWQSLVTAGIAERAHSVVIVNDGSSDDTRAVLDTLRESSDLAKAKLRPLHLEKNQGRFRARLAGARACDTASILFLDSRLTLPENFGASLARVSQEHASIVGSVDIDTERSRFCLYWDRSHRFMFRNHFRHAERPIILTPENFDSFLKGTGVFYCLRKDFVEACARFEDSDLLSDDTFLMRDMVAVRPMVVHPDVRVGWVPRETATEFIWRIWDRGPGFVEYHVFERRGGVYFWAVSAGMVATVGIVGLVAVAPPVGATVALGSVAAIAASTALIAKSPREFVTLAPLHTAVTLAFGAGVVRGIGVNALRVLRSRVKSWRGESAPVSTQPSEGSS
jgi:glycosyltransferase involved in cell wall biosynthesis